MGLTVSVVSPVYRGADTVEELHRRLSVVADGLDDEFEFVFVDDASPDDTSWDALVRIADRDPRVTAVRLAHNVRQTRAIFAGTELATGEAIVVMDSDLEDPPEVLPVLLEHFRHGHDLVVAARERHRTSFLRRAGSRALNAVAFALGLPITDIGSSFLVMARHVERGVRRELHRTGIQLVLPSNFASSEHPLTIPVLSAPPRPSNYASPALARMGFDFLAVYAAPRASWWCAVASVGSGALAARRRRSRAAWLLASSAWLVAGLWLRRVASRPRRDAAEPLYEIREVVGRHGAGHAPGTREA